MTVQSDGKSHGAQGIAHSATDQINEANHGAEVDLIIEKHGKLTGAFEIKSTSRVTGAQLSGLRPFRQEYPHVPLHVISLVDNSYRLEDVRVMPWQLYLEKINEYL